MGQPICVVDAFAAGPFTGNPAAVCVLEQPADEQWMQQVAGELNLSETAFLVPRSDGFDLRWFTPSVEVDLCGHATLASAHVLWETCGLEQVQFFTRKSGVLVTAQMHGRIEMDFPSQPSQQAPAPEGLAQALGARPVWVGKSKYDYLVELESEAVVRGLKPDHSALARLPVRGVIVCAQGKEFDFVSRFFAPGAGVAEDPVTGSAHCTLAPYWGEKLHKSVMHGYQASPRGGQVGVEMRGERVLLSGRAVTTWRGELLV